MRIRLDRDDSDDTEIPEDLTAEKEALEERFRTLIRDHSEKNLKFVEAGWELNQLKMNAGSEPNESAEEAPSQEAPNPRIEELESLRATLEEEMEAIDKKKKAVYEKLQEARGRFLITSRERNSELHSRHYSRTQESISAYTCRSSRRSLQHTAEI